MKRSRFCEDQRRQDEHEEDARSFRREDVKCSVKLFQSPIVPRHCGCVRLVCKCSICRGHVLHDESRLAHPHSERAPIASCSGQERAHRIRSNEHTVLI
jgi:hypothetical protein